MSKYAGLEFNTQMYSYFFATLNFALFSPVSYKLMSWQGIYKIKNKNDHTVGTVQNLMKIILEKEAKSIPHIYISACFPGLAQPLTKW